MTRKRVFALCLALAMLMSVMGGVASAVDPVAGENGYVSLHTYVSKTNDPSIVKVTHTVQGRIDIPAKKVVFVLDDSGSMTFDGLSDGVPDEVMAPVNEPNPGLNNMGTYDEPGLDSLGVALGGRPAATTTGTPYYYYDASSTLVNAAYKVRWNAMVENAVPAALKAMWGGAPSVAEKIEIAIVSFGSGAYAFENQGITGLAIKTTGGFVDYNNTNTFTPAGNLTPAWGASTGTGSGYSDLEDWIKNSGCSESGTRMHRGLDEAEALLAANVQPGDEVYILALTDGVDAAQAQAIIVANTLKTTYNAEIWGVTLNNDTPAIHTFMDTIASTSALSYKPYTQEAAENVFEDFGDKVKGASGIVAGLTPNTTSYDIVQVPGKSLYELKQSDGGMDMNVTLTGSKFEWTWAGALKNDVLYSLSYYLQAKEGEAGLYYDVLASSSFNYKYTDSAGVEQSVSKVFPTAYFAPNIGESVEKPGTVDQNTTTTAKTDGYTGMDQHQNNRDSAKTTIQTMSYSPNVKPLIGTLRVGTANNGRAKAIVEVENGTLMTYQWQFLDETSEKTDKWTDIFGATSSQYILSTKFKAGETYKLRCKISNPAGTVFLTDVLEVKATAAKKSVGLQSK